MEEPVLVRELPTRSRGEFVDSVALALEDILLGHEELVVAHIVADQGVVGVPVEVAEGIREVKASPLQFP